MTFERNLEEASAAAILSWAIETYGEDFATANAEFFRDGEARRGRQSQAWVRFPDGWKIVSAHVSLEGSHA